MHSIDILPWAHVAVVAAVVDSIVDIEDTVGVTFLILQSCDL